ncbi:MAG: sugar transferase [Candidatus Omnitrophica bacterium]|jgi:exopolysaccharide biosynthesis polyprenyl glycosylphosphotransferase|nr:sugar transferase [Candidatus Omnitrophota bacterium]
MHTIHRRVQAAYFFVDTLLIGFSFYLPCLLNPYLMPANAVELRLYLTVFSFWGIILIFILNNHQLYLTDRHISITQELFKVVRCILYSSILAALFIFLTKIDIFSRLVFLEATLLLTILLSGWRILKRIYVRRLIREGYGNYNVLIVGVNKQSLFLVEEIKNNPYLGLKVIGLVDGDRETNSLKEEGLSVLGKIDDLEKIVKKNFIDEIYITDISHRGLVSEVIRKAEQLGKTVRVLAEDFNLPYKMVGVNYIGITPLLTYYESLSHGSDSAIKRCLDIAVSIAALILLLPIFLAIAVLIKLNSQGPIFYVSKRCGKKGSVFNMYKFRSMVKGAEKQRDALSDKSDVKGPIFKIKKDPRLTRVGKVLRKYSLDELPQLFNILKGDMSLVGPRPFPEAESNKIEYQHIPRLNIRPGVTGLAQVKGRSNLKFNQWMRWDIWYVENWSLGLDVKILLWTIPAVLKGRGAY